MCLLQNNNKHNARWPKIHFLRISKWPSLPDARVWCIIWLRGEDGLVPKVVLATRTVITTVANSAVDLEETRPGLTKFQDWERSFGTIDYVLKFVFSQENCYLQLRYQKLRVRYQKMLCKLFRLLFHIVGSFFALSKTICHFLNCIPFLFLFKNIFL